MISVGMMQVPIDQIVNVVTMRDWLVTAVRPVDMAGIVLGAVVLRRTLGRVVRGNVDHMLLHNPVVPHTVQVAIMQIVSVIAVRDRRMPASRAMNVCMVVVGMISHQLLHLRAHAMHITWRQTVSELVRNHYTNS